MNQFTDPDTGMLFVYDLERGAKRRQKPSKVAHIRDFYRVEIEGEDPNQFERALSILESDAAPIIKNVNSDPAQVDSSDFGVLLEFCAFLAVRGPWMRRRSIELVSHHVEAFFSMLASDEGTYERYRRLRDLPPLPKEVRLRLADGIIVEPVQEGMAEFTVNQAQHVFNDMKDWAWGIFPLPPSAPSLVTSDVPVGRISLPLSTTLELTAFSISLGPRVALVSDFDPLRRWGFGAANHLNSATTLDASLVFSGNESPLDFL